MLQSKSYENLSSIDKRCINCLRFLAIDSIQKAASGHPGLPMGFMPIAYRLYSKHLRHNPSNPQWFDRDRFVLSAGHGSAMLYSLLHLLGYSISLDDLKNFRQLGSITPGHPEFRLTPGVEVTTGPLGQGFANAVGLAIGLKYLAEYFNRPNFSLIKSRVFVIVGDGCLQEGVSSEAASLAGHLGLDNLHVLYDDNQVTIDGSTDLSFSENVKLRFEAYNWAVHEMPGDAHDLEQFDNIIGKIKNHSGSPSLVKISSIIGFGSPNKQNTSSVHGSPLGKEEIELTKKALGWEHNEEFFIPQEVKERFQEIKTKGQELESNWNQQFEAYQKEYPELAREFQQSLNQKSDSKWEKLLPIFPSDSKIATRSASGKVLDSIMPSLPLVMGGSADLSPSNNTYYKGATSFQKNNPLGRYIHYGVREHAMGSIMNGISVTGMLRAYGATFLSISDYMLPAIRVASLSGYPTIFVFTHDSIGLGEDGPTHQPVEQISYLRALPRLISFRPADANETVMAWKYALNHHTGPVAISLSRQALPVFDRSICNSADNLLKGAYVLISDPDPEILLIATGSEVSLAYEAKLILNDKKISVRVISMPSCELFDLQSKEYQDSVLPPHIEQRIVIEAGIGRGWEKYMGNKGKFIGMNDFGESAPAEELFQKFEITANKIVEVSGF